MEYNYSGLEREALANGATAEDAKALNKVAACLIVGNYPSNLAVLEDRSGNSGYLCHLGVIAGQFDEFFSGMSGGRGYELLTSDTTNNLVAVQTEIPFVPILGIAGYLSVKLQKLTGNIWLGGLVNAMLITMITVSNTSFTFPY